jgi:hypothetical protein
MKTQKIEVIKNYFNEFALSNEEMINVRGGEGETIPTLPPVKI